MNRLARPILMLACSGPMILLLALAANAQAPVRVNSNPIKVPDDYSTIQQAIDAAPEGAEIWVATGFYYESLSITKGITLSGSWDISFTHRFNDVSHIHGQDLYRPISITCPTSDTVVTIDGFSVEMGNATNRGGGPAGLSAVEDLRWGTADLQGPWRAPAIDPMTPAERLARLQADLAGAVERGLYPGGSAAYRSMLEKVQQQIARLEQVGAQPQVSQSPSQEGVDCGGGIYSWNASLHLMNSTLSSNVASQMRDGRGGGVCVGQSAPGGVLIRGNTLLLNIASAAANSVGVGGGLYAYNTPGMIVEDNVFQENSAASGGSTGAGGGLAVEASSGVVLRDNHVLRNTASSGWETSTGEGGGASLLHVIGANIADNKFQENLAGVHGTGLGGALFVNGSGLVTVSDNDVIGNWASMFQMDMMASEGGGITLYATNHISVTGNVIENNTATVSGPEVGVAYGGGLNGEVSQNVHVADNTFGGNVASLTANGDGGGASLVKTSDSEVVGNSFAGNVGSLAQAEGSGGGLYLLGTQDCRVKGNAFQGNVGSAGSEGNGGGIRVSEMGLSTIDTTVDANLFLNNRASADLPSPLESYGGACSFISEGLVFTNNVVVGNSAGVAGGVGLTFAAGNGKVTNNTLVGNSDAAILVDVYNVSPITITNNIVVSHTVGISVPQGAAAIVNYTLWHGNGTDIAGAGVVTQTHPVIGSPAFVDPAADNYRLTVVSAARDAGDPAGVPPAPDHDADGVIRPQGPAVDLGAYEWKGYWLHLPVVFK